MTKTFSQFITDIARKSTAYVEATNESYIQYEKATGTQIIQRDSSGEAIRGDNSGIYQLIPDKDLTKTRGRNDEVDAFRHAYSDMATISRTVFNNKKLKLCPAIKKTIIL